MPAYPYDKSPAFFRVMSPELFFEVEALESASSIENVELDSELDAILNGLEIQ